MKVRGWILACLLIAAPAAAQDVIPDLRASRAALPTPMSPQQISDMLSRVGSQHPGWGMLRKDSGNRCPTPYPGISISCDWMVYAPTRWGYDILRDQEGSGEISPSDGAALSPGQEVVFPWPSGGASPTPSPTPSPVPQQPNQTPDLSAIERRLDVTDASRERMFADLVNRDNARAAQLAAVDDRLKKHDEEPSWFRRFFTDRATLASIGAVLTTFFATR